MFNSEMLQQQQIEKFMGEKFHNSVEIILSPSYFRRNGKSIFDLYVNAVQSMAFKSKCDILIDTYSNCVYPWTNISYIHFPLSSAFQSHFPYIKTPNFWSLVNLPYAFFEQKLMRYEDKLLLANSYFTANVIKKSLNIDAYVLYPPVHLSFFERNLRQNEGKREDLVVTCSRISSDKSLETIFDIVALTNKKIRFVIVGFSSEEKLEHLIHQKIKKLQLSDRVSFLTDVSRSQLIEILCRAKVYLHTKIMEHFGISIAEAMATGCIPIVHNSGGAKEFVPFKFRYENYYDVVQKIEDAISNWSANYGQKMSKVAERFSSKNFSDKFLSLFLKYLEKVKM